MKLGGMRRNSLESSFKRQEPYLENSLLRTEEHKLDHIEKELKKTTCELQKKLSINPKGHLNIR